MICILAPFNPKSIVNYLYKNQEIPDINISANSINNLVKGLILQKESILVVTLNFNSKNDLTLYGHRIEVVALGVHKLNPVFDYFPFIGNLANVLYKPVVKRLDQISVIHAHWCYEYALCALKFADSKPVLCTVRDFASEIYKSISISSSIYSIFVKSYWKYKCKIFDKVINSKLNFIANSEYTKDLLVSKNHNIKPYLIYNSIENDLILGSAPYLGDRKNIVTISYSLDDKRKNIPGLLCAFSKYVKRFPNHTLILIGNYHKNRGVYKLACKLNLYNKVKFTGVLCRKDIIKYIDSSFMMVHPSYEETFGNIILEALSRGIFCVGGNHSGAVPYILNRMGSGFVCDVSNSNNIQEVMTHISKNVNNYDLERQKALKIISDLYSNDVIIDKHIKLYQHLSQNI